MAEQRKIYSIGELNRAARTALERGVGEVWVEGEISRLTRHASGHWYFTLKDEFAAASCAMFKQHSTTVMFKAQDGMQVRALGLASLYEPRGNYQLIVRTMEEAGKGSLQEQFEKLKLKLTAEGLFDPSRKKPLPALPQKIGVVTSPTGAAVRDIIQVLTRRFPNIEILLAPVTVQGTGAAQSIANAIRYLNKRNTEQAGSLPSEPKQSRLEACPALGIDLLIVGRGGGSLEDLWAFNEEVVARAIAGSNIPVISAVGHEIDFTISDFVADMRAPTPSAAAELAVPVKAEIEERMERLTARLGSSLQHRARLLHGKIPGFRQSMTYALRTCLQQRQQRIDEASVLLSYSLKKAVSEQRQRLPGLQQTMLYSLQTAAAERKQTLHRLSAQLRALSPLGVLERGYSLTQTSDGRVIRNSSQLKAGDILRTRLAAGTVISEVKKKESPQ